MEIESLEKTNPEKLSDEELDKLIKAKDPEAKAAESEFRVKLWDHIGQGMNGPVTCKVHLFTECLRIVFEKDRDLTRDLRASEHQPVSRDEWSYADNDDLIEAAEDLFRKAYLSDILHSKDSGMWDLEMTWERKRSSLNALRHERKKRKKGGNS